MHAALERDLLLPRERSIPGRHQRDASFPWPPKPDAAPSPRRTPRPARTKPTPARSPAPSPQGRYGRASRDAAHGGGSGVTRPPHGIISASAVCTKSPACTATPPPSCPACLCRRGAPAGSRRRPRGAQVVGRIVDGPPRRLRSRQLDQLVEDWLHVLVQQDAGALPRRLARRLAPAAPWLPCHGRRLTGRGLP